MGFTAFGAEECAAVVFGFFCVEPRAGEDIKVHAFFELRKVRGHGTGFDKLDERVAGRDGVIMTEMRNERLPVPFHFYHTIAKRHDKLFYLAFGRDFFQVTVIEVQYQLLSEKIPLFFIWRVYHRF